MHLGQQRFVEGIGQLQRAEAAALQFMLHMVDTGRHLEAGHQLATEHFDFALVQCVLVVVDGEHEKTGSALRMPLIMPHAAARPGAGPAR